MSKDEGYYTLEEAAEFAEGLAIGDIYWRKIHFPHLFPSTPIEKEEV